MGLLKTLLSLLSMRSEDTSTISSCLNVVTGQSCLVGYEENSEFKFCPIAKKKTVTHPTHAIFPYQNTFVDVSMFKLQPYGGQIPREQQSQILKQYDSANSWVEWTCLPTW